MCKFFVVRVLFSQMCPGGIIVGRFNVMLGVQLFPCCLDYCCLEGYRISRSSMCIIFVPLSGIYLLVISLWSAWQLGCSICVLPCYHTENLTKDQGAFLSEIHVEGTVSLCMRRVCK